MGIFANKSLFAASSDQAGGSEINQSTDLVRSQYKEGELEELCAKEIKDFKEQLENWRNQRADKKSDVETLLQYEDIVSRFNNRVEPLSFMSSVSDVSYIRNESSKCAEDLEVTRNEILTNKENYKLLENIRTTDVDEQRLLTETKLDFEKRGITLDDDKRERFKDLLNKLTEINLKFSENLNEDTTTVTLSEAELKGVSADYLSRFEKDGDGNYILTTKYPDFSYVMENVESSSARKKMFFAFNNHQALENTALLKESLIIKSQLAKLQYF
jgi:Zn-dependent oligopeptidase